VIFRDLSARKYGKNAQKPAFENSEVQSSDILISKIKFLMMISLENTAIWMFLIENIAK
jgi:hypothetical protein